MQQIYIDLYRDANPFVTDAYDRVISKIPIMKAQQGYKLFTLSGCEPGVGTTTIAINIAASLAAAGWNTLLVDADIRKGPQAKRLNQGLTRGLSDYLTGRSEFSEIVCGTTCEYLNYIACGERTESPSTLFNSVQFDRFIEHITEEYDYAIFDSPTQNAAVDAGIIARKTSGVILVAGYMQTRMAQIRAARRELARLNANVIGIMLNRVPRTKYQRYVGNYDYFARGDFIQSRPNVKEQREKQPAQGK